MSAPEETLAFQLRAMKIPFEREYRFAPPRRWRADFALWDFPANQRHNIEADILIEVEGGAYVQGRHTRGPAFEKDCEKYAEAAILGYRVIRVTPRQVENGQALAWIERALGREEKAA